MKPNDEFIAVCKKLSPHQQINKGETSPPKRIFMLRKNLICCFLVAVNIGIFSGCSPANTEKNVENITVKPTENVIYNANNKPKENAEKKKQDELIEIFDGRKDFDYRDYSKEETNLVQTEFDRKKAEIKQKFGDRYCGENEDENVGLNGIVKGSFTKPNSNQKAFLYTVCSSGSSHFGVGGIIIFESDRAISHYVYGENGLDQGMIALSDINKDGMDELVLLDFQVHQGYGGGAISIVEFSNGKFNFIGTTTTFSDNGGAVEDEKNIKADAYDIFVQPGSNPVFYRDSYQKKGNSKNWSLVKRGEKFTLDKIEAEYLQNYKKIGD